MSLLKKKEKIRDDLNKSRNQLLNFIDTLTVSQTQLRMEGENNDSWTVFEVLKHLYSAEDGMTKLMAGIKAGGSGVSEDFDLNRYNKSRVNKLKDFQTLDDLKDLLNKSRKALFLLLEELDGKDFEKKGRHAVGKILTIEQIFSVCHIHEHQHLQKCQEVLKSSP